jgi:hypothetical protein
MSEVLKKRSREEEEVVAAGVAQHDFHVEVIERKPNLVQSVTKPYGDGRTLTLTLVDGMISEKSLTFPWTLDFDAVRLEMMKGTEVSMKYCEKEGMEVELTYFGPQLIGKMITLTTEKLSVHRRSLLIADTWACELEGEPNFPSINIERLVFKNGYIADQEENEFLRLKMNGIVRDTLEKHDQELEEMKMPASATDNDAENPATDRPCDDCKESPCVFLKERKNIVAQDKAMHGGTSTANSTRRRTAFKHMFYVLNGGPGTNGIRKRHPTCVETGIRGLFPDSQYMGYKEK